MLFYTRPRLLVLSVSNAELKGGMFQGFLVYQRLLDALLVLSIALFAGSLALLMTRSRSALARSSRRPH